MKFVTDVIKEEEEAFLKTIEAGLKIFKQNIAENLTSINKEWGEIFKKNGDQIDKAIEPVQALLQKKIKEATKETAGSLQQQWSLVQNIKGDLAFKLKDTYGFPIDLTQLIAKQIGWTVDMDGYNKELEQQKQGSRGDAKVDTEDWIVLDDYARNEFIGYDELESRTKVVKYRKVKAKGKEGYQIVLEVTPFYAESGGQVGDTGELIINNEKLIITDTKKDNDLIIHFTDAIPGDLAGEVIARVDPIKRKNTELHHSATHLVHSALRKVLGTHVTQKGSLVNDEHLRFDFSHFAKVSDEEMATVETLVNKKIRENIPVVIKQMPKDEAMKIGAMALFGEKYGDVVRVVIIDPTYSVELCGGTHVGSTGELGVFKITHETAVAAGVRRIEAFCGEAAEEYLNSKIQELNLIKDQFKNPKDILKTVETTLAENTMLKKQLEHFENKLLGGIRNELLQKNEIINGINFIGGILEVTNAEALKKLCFDLKNHLDNYVVVLCANIAGKPSVAISIDEKIVASKNLDAGKIIKEHVASLVKGGGGGQKTLATAGGQDASNLQKVIDTVKNLLK